MYKIFKNVIENGSYELADILGKINVIWVQGGISEEERAELSALAREKADPERSYAPLQSQIDKLAGDLESLSARVAALEGETEPEEWQEYVQPTGAHDAYYNGDKVIYNGDKYICTAPEGTACVWTPDAYPAYWQIQE